MAEINMGEVMRQVGAYFQTEEGKALLKERTKGAARETLREAAEKMIGILRATAASFDLPESVQQHFASLQVSAPREGPDGTYSVEIYFSDDLHRDSLEPQNYDGVNNVVALLNNGYDEHPAMAHVWGYWHGAHIHGLTERTGLQFMQQAVHEFNSLYGAKYGVTAVAGEDYD